MSRIRMECYPHIRDASPGITDRRRFQRIRLLGEVLGQTAPFGTPLKVLDLGVGGFAIESAVAFELNTEYTFQFFALDTRYGPIRARNVHCLRFSRDGAMICVAGFSFVLRTAAEQHTVNGLMAEAQDLYLHRHAPA